ncbi:MAG: acyl-CoA dehydrogenase [Gammaproteobacteria bacterium]|nr:acyl-CoA dehydrogenase [Gammaproteobacteria bacterium]MYF59197.1 acyl-CoA dehydrogenase [Gammaproteobacteria bacterium]
MRAEFIPPELPEAAEALRAEVRAFLADALRDVPLSERALSWDACNPDFSRRMGEAGFIGLSFPEEYGGAGRSQLERFVVLEECLAAGAPTGFHWFADRQSGPLILRYGSEELKRSIIPRICRGELCFCIGMSEPDSGSDLASLRTRATRTSSGWRVNGTKIWTTNAHRAHYMIALFRTGEGQRRNKGLSQFLVDLRNTPGLRIAPIRDIAGREHFNEVHFEGALLAEDALIGIENEGWAQVIEELALERSGPERYLSCQALFNELLRVLKESEAGDTAAEAIGGVVAQLGALRAMSLSVAAMIQAGESPNLEAAIVKDMGTRFEQSIPSLAQELVDLPPETSADALPYQQALHLMTILAPSFSLRGGSGEILRGIIARGLGLR